MMNKLSLLFCLLLLVPDFARAEASATQPGTNPAIVTGTLGKAEEDITKIVIVLGHHGVLFVRSEARWDELNKLWSNLTPDTPLPKLDFTKQNIVLVYNTYQRETEKFSLLKSDLAAKPPRLDFLLARDYSPDADTSMRHAKFILAMVPVTPGLIVTLGTIPKFSTELLIVTEFSAILGGKDGGDIVDGLQAVITPKAATIKPGEDILIDFELHLASMPDAHPQHFGTAPKSVHVWDAVFSGGYQNYSYLVTSPDGKTRRLQRPAQIFQRNISRKIEITADKPYLLLEGSFENTAKSLKGLGLDTTAPGSYTITGLYEELASVKTEGGKTTLWGGSIASNTITVEVKK